MTTLPEVIAERRFDLDIRADRTRVLVQLGRPQCEHEPEGPWGCPMRVVSPGRTTLRTAVGASAFDALRLALQMVRQELIDDLPGRTGGQVSACRQPAAGWFATQCPRTPPLEGASP